MRPTYIRNNAMYGLKYDYTAIGKDFTKMLKKCGAPEGLYMPNNLPFNDVNWLVLMSERSSSKTTQLLLFFMVINKLYGSKFAYLRREKQHITKSMYDKMFNVINNPVYDYVGYLTSGKYNAVTVDRTTKNIFYCFRNNETGKIEDQSELPIGVLMAVEESRRYMSTFNLPDYDHVLYDEFSWGVMPNEFEMLCQLIQTLRRERENLKILLASNTITPYHQLLRELGISSLLAKMKKGQHRIHTTDLGTKVYCELLDVGMHQTTEFKQASLQYFGFDNESLRSLYGGEWEIKGFRHLPQSETREINYYNIMLEYMGNFMRLASFTDGMQLGMFISAYTGKPKSDSIIVTDAPVYNTEQVNYRLPELMRKLMSFDSKGMLYFSDNETALQYHALKASIICS